MKYWTFGAFFWVIVSISGFYNMEFKDANGNPFYLKDKISPTETLKNAYNSPCLPGLRRKAFAGMGNLAYATVSGNITTKEFWNVNEWYYVQNPEQFTTEIVAICDLDGRRKAFEDLELHEGATDEEIKKAARRIRKLYHPDLCKLPPDVCVEKFQIAQGAYETLTAAFEKKSRADPEPEEAKPKKIKKSRKKKKTDF